MEFCWTLLLFVTWKLKTWIRVSRDSNCPNSQSNPPWFILKCRSIICSEYWQPLTEWTILLRNKLILDGYILNMARVQSNEILKWFVCTRLYFPISLPTNLARMFPKTDWHLSLSLSRWGNICGKVDKIPPTRLLSSMVYNGLHSKNFQNHVNKNFEPLIMTPLRFHPRLTESIGGEGNIFKANILWNLSFWDWLPLEMWVSQIV